MSFDLIGFELKKLLKSKAALGAILITLLVLLGLFYGKFFNGQLSGYASEAIHGREAVLLNSKIAESHAGALSDERIKAVVTDFANNKKTRDKQNFFDVFSFYVSRRFIDNQEAYLDEIDSIEKDGSFEIEKIQLKKVEDLTPIRPVSALRLGHFSSWHQLIEVTSLSFILINLLVIFLISPIFSGDRAKGLLPLLLTTKYGRTKLIAAKLSSVFILTSVVFGGIHLINLVVFTSYFGLSGWNTSIQLNFQVNLMSFPVEMNFLSLLALLLIYQYIGILFIMAMTVLISNSTKTIYTSLAISVGSFFAPQLLAQVFREGLINKLLMFFPSTNTDTETFLMKLSSSEGLIFNNFHINFAFLIVVMLVFILFSNRTIYSSYRREGID